jgi:hypothetical protein
MSWPVTLPKPFQCFGKGLPFHCAVNVPGVASKNELAMIAFGGQRRRHALIGLANARITWQYCHGSIH